MRDGVYEENIKFATKQCSSVSKRQNKKKASKETGTVKTSMKGEENRKEDTALCTKGRLFTVISCKIDSPKN